MEHGNCPPTFHIPDSTHFHRSQGTSQLQYGYWLGLSWDPDNNLWNWQDGDDAGNGEVKNAYPYSHWWVAHVACSSAPQPHVRICPR